MTSKKKSTSSLKLWVRTVKRYEYELPKLYEKLEYLQVKSIGYNSPSFEPKFGGRGTSNNYSIDYWLERIEACEAQIKKREKEIIKFNKFTNDLDEISKDIFLKHYYYNVPVVRIAEEYRLKPFHIYELFNEMKKL